MNSVKGPQTKEKEGAKAKPIDALFISFSSQSVTYGIYHLRARGKVRTKGETSIWEVRAVEGERVKKYPRQREENRGSEFQKVMDVIHGCPRRRLPSRMDVNGAVGEREREDKERTERRLFREDPLKGGRARSTASSGRERAREEKGGADRTTYRQACFSSRIRNLQDLDHKVVPLSGSSQAT